MTLFWMIFANNVLVLAITVAAAAKRPIWKYRFIAGIAVCAFIASLHQALTNHFTWLAVLSTLLLTLAVIHRVLINLSGMSKHGRQ